MCFKLIYFTTYDPKVRRVDAQSLQPIGDLFPQNIHYVDMEGNSETLVAVDGLVVIDFDTVIPPENMFKQKEVELSVKFPHHNQELLPAREYKEHGKYENDNLKVWGITFKGNPFTLYNIDFLPFSCT